MSVVSGLQRKHLGIAEAALEAAMDYAKERVQFGKPIAAQQGIGFKLADMATALKQRDYLFTVQQSTCTRFTMW